ncbi:hypothetical protein GWK51_14560 [Acinetobacter sp. PS-1]|nr:hypothetical protein [Acinetobacter kanungonis]
MFGHVMPDEQDTYDYYEYIPQQTKAYAKWIKKLKTITKNSVSYHEKWLCLCF